MTGHMFDGEDADLHAALRAMPTARAPHTLAPRVMAAVHARLAQQAAAVRTWFDWSVPAQLASVLAFVALVAGAAMVWPSVQALVSRATDVDAVRVGAVLFRSWQPLMVWVLAGTTVTILFCATVGALVGRLALGGASR